MWGLDAVEHGGNSKFKKGDLVRRYTPPLLVGWVALAVALGCATIPAHGAPEPPIPRPGVAPDGDARLVAWEKVMSEHQLGDNVYLDVDGSVGIRLPSDAVPELVFEASQGTSRVAFSQYSRQDFETFAMNTSRLAQANPMIGVLCMYNGWADEFLVYLPHAWATSQYVEAAVGVLGENVTVGAYTAYFGVGDP